MAAVSGTHRMRLKALDAVIESLPRGQYNRKIRLNDGPPIPLTHSVFDLWVSAETDSTKEALDLRGGPRFTLHANDTYHWTQQRKLTIKKVFQKADRSERIKQTWERIKL